MAKKHNIICPICKKSDMVVKIVYGLPTDKTMQEFENGTIYIGGCMIPIPKPKWYCKRDEKEF